MYVAMSVGKNMITMRTMRAGCPWQLEQLASGIRIPTAGTGSVHPLSRPGSGPASRLAEWRIGPRGTIMIPMTTRLGGNVGKSVMASGIF